MLKRNLVVVTVLAVVPVGAAGARGQRPDCLRVARAYADAMIAHARDTCGKVQSPLFAAALDRKTMKLPAAGRAPGIEGVRSGDRTLTGANPMHDQNLYQLLYALAKVTGKQAYADEADKALKWFFQHCQSKTTGLLAWGEHMGWDFAREGPIRDNHEYARPWMLWERSFPLAPAACTRFARGVWDHQIGDRKTGNFSRHARYTRHAPGTNSQYPRHGGFYIATWGHAYQRTKDPVFLKAIETVLGHFDSRRNPKTGAVPCESTSRSRGKTMWPESNLSLAIDLADAAPRVPAELAEKMRANAAKTDRVYLKLAHDLGPGGRGFVSGAATDTLKPFDKGPWTATRTWSNRYGAYTDAQVAMMCWTRWRQVKLDGYRKLFRAAAERYVKTDPDTSRVIWPGVFGDAIWLLVEAHRMTGRKEYLPRAEQLAAKAVDVYFPDGCPLPKASPTHNHYEAITRGDTLAAALLNLWAAKNRPDLELNLQWVDR